MGEYTGDGRKGPGDAGERGGALDATWDGYGRAGVAYGVGVWVAGGGLAGTAADG